jgi:Fur family transcriptional regulator, peroxide stress response regulator
MNEESQAMRQFIAACRGAGLKATRQRIAIYGALVGTSEHPSADVLWRRVRKRLPSLSFDTVYRTLRSLQESGLIARVASGADKARFDGNMAHHHHFVCSQCGQVRDFHHRKFDRLVPPAEVHDFGVADRVQVEVRGLCHTCAAARTRAEAGRRRGTRG